MASYFLGDSFVATDLQPNSLNARRKAWKFGLLAVVGITVVATAVVLIPRGSASPTTSQIKTHTIRRGDLIVSITEKGTLESSKNTEIKCQIRGGYGGRGGHSLVTYVIPSGSMVKRGDLLVKLDSKVIEETISLGKTDTNNAKAALARAEVDFTIAKNAIDTYLNGHLVSQKQALQNRLDLAERNVERAEDGLRETQKLFGRGYVNRLEVEATEFAVRRAKLQRDLNLTEIDVLERLTQKMRLETLNGQLTATEARLKGRQAGVELEQGRLDLALEEYENCNITAPRDGLVIYPSTAQWKDSPDIAEGVSVRNNQILLLMPDLREMRLTVGIHESIVDRVKANMVAKVTTPNQTFDTSVTSIGQVAAPEDWWSGDVVEYDAIIDLPVDDDLRPGMSADVEIVIAQHSNVLTIPAAAVVETKHGAFCWVKTDAGTSRRKLTLGDSNDEFLVVEKGLDEGNKVVLDPLSSVDDARELVASAVHTVERGTLIVSATEMGTLESSNNTLVKCRVRGASTVNWVIESGTQVKAGDELVRLENGQIEEHIHERTKFAYLSRDAAVGARAEATVAGMAIDEYLEGRYRTQVMTLERDLAISEQSLRHGQDTLNHVELMRKRGFRSELQLLKQRTTVQAAALDVQVKNAEIKALKDYAKDEQLITLRGNWKAAKAAADGHEEVLKADEARIAQAKEELQRCVVKAPRDGLVIYPRGKVWKDEPDVAEGATVRNDQVLLLMPDLSKMQARVEIHESVVDSVKVGMIAAVKLPSGTFKSKVISVAAVTAPGGWWEGNIAKYDTVIELPALDELKPGMSAEVKIELAHLDDVLTIPIPSVVETNDGTFCWVGDRKDPQRRKIQLGKGNDDFVIVEKGLREGDNVIVDPPAWESPD